MSNADSSKVTKRALAFPGDGLLDIFLGLTLLDAWTILRNPPGRGSGGLFVILFPILLDAKRAITVPRLPLQSAPPEAASHAGSKKRGDRGVLALALAAVVLALLGAGALSRAAPGRAGLALWEIVVLAGILCVAAAGTLVGARRFVVYAGATGIALVFAMNGRAAVGVHLVPVLATGMVAWGGVLLARFLAIRPRAA